MQGRRPRPRESSSYDAEERHREAPASLPDSPPCPFCAGRETELMSAFGSHASVSTYWCRACGSPFELMKWTGEG
jgi:hypothetical protein